MDAGSFAGIGPLGIGPVVPLGQTPRAADTIKAQKAALRQEMRRAVADLDPSWRRAADAAITSNVLSSPWWHDASCVSCFVSLPSEIDTTPLIEDALLGGKRLCVPLCTAPGQMELHEIDGMGDLAPGTAGILEPRPETPLVSPGEVFLSIVPCTACSPDGLRLGKGGGYYDRFLAGYRGIAATLSYEALLVDDIPMDVHDMPVPLVVTERGVRHHGRLVS